MPSYCSGWEIFMKLSEKMPSMHPGYWALPLPKEIMDLHHPANWPVFLIMPWIPILHKLVKGGFRVAICDQLEDPKLAKGIVKRGVTEMVTPGTATQDKLLEHHSNNFLAAIHIWRILYRALPSWIFPPENFLQRRETRNISISYFKP